MGKWDSYAVDASQADTSSASTGNKWDKYASNDTVQSTQPITSSLLMQGAGATGALALGGAAVIGANALKPIAQQIPAALSANYGRGDRADAFANKVQKAFVQTHTDQVNRFGADLKSHMANNPGRMVDLSDLVTDIQSNPDLSRQAVNILKKAPVLEDILANPKAASSVSLDDTQKIINHLNSKVKSGGYDVQEALNNIKGSQLEAFPEMAETRANYRDFIEPYNQVKKYFKMNRTLPAIENKFKGAQGNVRVNKIMPEDIMSEINSYRVASKLVAPQNILGRMFGKVGGFLSTSAVPLQAVDMANQFNQWRQKAKQQPNSISTLDPLSGMPRIINPQDLVA